MQLFSGVVYHISSSFSESRRNDLTHILTSNGAIEAQALEDATHILTNSHSFENRKKDLKEGTACITDEWVDRSMVLGKLQQVSHYSPDPMSIFSGVVACATQLPATDLEVLAAGIIGLGGQWRGGLAKDVTHLFTLSDSSDKYRTALHYQQHTHVKIVLPHWFDDSVRLGVRGLTTKPYEWPNPLLLQTPVTELEPNSSSPQKRRGLDSDKKTLFKNAVWSPSVKIPDSPTRNVWDGRNVFLSPSLLLREGMREAVEAGIKRANGRVVELKAKDGVRDLEEELARVDQCDIFITRFRAGRAYVKAVREEKTIGTLTWLFHVQSTGVISRPLDQLLHYPIPKRPIEGFAGHEITVTNYTGEAREYLKKLITTMGATFTPSMSGKNTVLVAAYLSGTKTTKAASWSIPIVNHTWLEDCFIRWRNLTVGVEKYIVFPPGVDFSTMLGERGVGRAVEEVAEEELELLELEADEESVTDLTTVAKTSPTKEQRTTNEATEEPAVDVTMADPHDDNESPLRLRSVDGNEGALRSTSMSPKQHDLSHSVKTGPPIAARKGGRTRPKPVAISPKKVLVAEETSPPTRKRKVGPQRNEVEEVGDERPEPIASTSRPRNPKKVLPRSPSPDKQVNTSVPRSTRAKTRGKATESQRRKDTIHSDDEQSDSETDQQPAKAVKSTRKGKGKAVAKNQSDEEDEEPLEVPVTRGRLAKKSHAEPPEKDPQLEKTSTTTLKRVVSVMMPPLSLTPKGTGKKATPITPQNISRTESIHAFAAEHTDSPGTRLSTTSKTKARPIAVSPPLSVRGSSRRTAATKASQRLHDEIMPDVMNYQQQLRNHKGKRGLPPIQVESEPLTKKKRPSDVQSEGDRVTAKRRKLSTGGSQPPDDEDSDEDSVKEEVEKPIASSSRPAKTKAGDPSIVSSQIRLMTTQVSLSDDVLKVLSRLGVKITTRPADCTHLIAPHLVRTEKFLGALAVAPWILSEEWALASAAAKRLLPEAEYILKDSANEKKYHFRLVDALKRAKTLNGKLFDKQTFYITPKVPADYKLLRNVVIACGGQVSNQVPTLRILNASQDRHVVSCAEDISIWRPLAQSHTIYTQELILTSVLTQEVKWDRVEYQVTSSA